MTFFELTLNGRHIVDQYGNLLAFESKDSAIDFAVLNQIRYDAIIEVGVLPISKIRELEERK